MARRVLHLGPYQPVLEEALRKELTALRAVDPLLPVIVLTPTALLCTHLKRSLAASTGGHQGVRFLTMLELARWIAGGALRGEGLAPLPPGGETVLWRRAVSAAPVGGYFEGIRRTRGFPAAARSTIRDLKDAGITPAVIERRAGGSSRLERKLRDLAAIWRRAEEAMRGAGMHDDLDLLREAGHLAEESPRLEGAACLLYGFYDLTRAQRHLVRGFLSPLRPLAAAFLPWEDHPDFAYAEGARDFLQGTLELLPENELRPAKPLPEVRVIAAPGEAGEAREVARAVLTGAGPLRETGVLLRSSGQGDRLEEAFVDAGVPRYLAEELPLARLPAARALGLLLALRREDLPRREVMELVTTTPMRFESLLGDRALPVVPVAWDRLSREWGVVGGIAEWRTRLDAGQKQLERGGTPEWLARARSLRRLIDAIAEPVLAIPLESSWSEMSAALAGAWRAVFDFGEEGLPVSAAIEGLSRLEALGRATFTEAEEVLAAALEEPAPLSAGTSVHGPGVVVAEIMKARGLPFQTVIVPGMVEGGFPRQARPDPLLSDFERRQLNRELSAGEEVFAFERGEPAVEQEADLGADGPLPLKASSAAEERLLFRLCLQAAPRVVLTLPRVDPGSARERVPSWLIISLLEAIHRRETPLSIPELSRLPEVTWIPLDPSAAATLPAVTAVERDLSDLAREGGFAAGRILARTPFGRQIVESEQARWGLRRFTPWDGWLEGSADSELRPALAKAGINAGRPVSPTRLETWATCPYQDFLRHALQLHRIDDAERRFTLEGPDRGMVIHRVLERFWRGEKESGRLPLGEESLGEALTRLETVTGATLEEFASLWATRPSVLWEAERTEIAGDLREAVRSTVGETEWVPEAFELDFGMVERSVGGRTRRQLELFPERSPAAGLEPVELRLPDGQRLLLRGRIDRIDLSRDRKRGRVVDYKSGRVGVRFRGQGDERAIFRGGAAVQLPIYVLAARARFPGVQEWEAVYDYCTRRGGFRREGLVVDPEVLARLQELVAGMAADSAAGRYPFRPEEEICRRCDYREICGPAHETAFEAKRDDPAFAPFLRRVEEFR